MWTALDEPPLKPKQVWSIRFHLQREQRAHEARSTVRYHGVNLEDALALSEATEI